jgi:phage replication-related protein YjqB (UPF0714/DUF867 family)
MADRYKTYSELARAEKMGVDYRICVADRGSFAVIVAPHGGRIEPGTSKIAYAIADDVYSLYCFEGLKRKHSFKDLHITSSRFDEPECFSLIARHKTVLAVHGRRGGDKVAVGGLHTPLRDLIVANLEATRFPSEAVYSGKLAGVSSDNICNKSETGAGAQLEIPRKLRDVLCRDRHTMTAFADSIRKAICTLQEAQ